MRVQDGFFGWLRILVVNIIIIFSAACGAPGGFYNDATGCADGVCPQQEESDDEDDDGANNNAGEEGDNNASAPTGCQSDDDCRGDRICREDGTCGPPPTEEEEEDPTDDTIVWETPPTNVPSETLGTQALLTAIRDNHGQLPAYIVTDIGGDPPFAPTWLKARVTGLVDGIDGVGSHAFVSFQVGYADEPLVWGTDVPGIAQGMSGSPLVVFVDGEWYHLGAVSYGPGYAPLDGDPSRFFWDGWATSLDLMRRGASGEQIDPIGQVGQPTTSVFVSGSTPLPFQLQESLSERFRTAGVDVPLTFGGVAVGSATSAACADAPTTLFPGASLGVPFVWPVQGPGFFSAGTVGSATDVQGGTWIGFGHPAFAYAGSGEELALDVWPAHVEGLSSNLFAPYKQGVLCPNPIATLTRDHRTGVSGTLETGIAEPIQLTFNTTVVGQRGDEAQFIDSYRVAKLPDVSLSAVFASLAWGSTVEGRAAHLPRIGTVSYRLVFRYADHEDYEVDLDLVALSRVIPLTFNDLAFLVADEWFSLLIATLYHPQFTVYAGAPDEIMIETIVSEGLHRLTVQAFNVPTSEVAQDERFEVVISGWDESVGEAFFDRITLRLPSDFPVGDAVVTISQGTAPDLESMNSPSTERQFLDQARNGERPRPTQEERRSVTIQIVPNEWVPSEDDPEAIPPVFTHTVTFDYSVNLLPEVLEGSDTIRVVLGN